MAQRPAARPRAARPRAPARGRSIRTVLGPATSSRTISTLLARPNAIDLQHRLHSQIIAELRDSVDLSDPVGLRQEIERLFNRFMTEEDVLLNRSERGRLL